MIRKASASTTPTNARVVTARKAAGSMVSIRWTSTRRAAGAPATHETSRQVPHAKFRVPLPGSNNATGQASPSATNLHYKVMFLMN